MRKKEKPGTDWLTAEQAAEIAGVTPKTIREWIDRKIFPARKKGFGKTSPYLIPRAEFMAAIKRRDEGLST